jgi:hypothetical protein
MFSSRNAWLESHERIRDMMILRPENRKGKAHPLEKWRYFSTFIPNENGFGKMDNQSQRRAAASQGSYNRRIAGRHEATESWK